MEFIVRVENRLGDHVLSIDDVVKVARPECGFQAEELGLTLEQGKTVLHEIQKLVAAKQILTLSVAERDCGTCGRRKSIKDTRTKRLWSVFGELRLRAKRLNSCGCLGAPRRVEWPLSRFREQSLPELRYLIGRWAADMPYRQAANLLSTFLPMPDDRGDFAIEVRRGHATVTVLWPEKSANECAAWLREYLRS